MCLPASNPDNIREICFYPRIAKIAIFGTLIRENIFLCKDFSIKAIHVVLKSAYLIFNIFLTHLTLMFSFSKYEGFSTFR